MKNKLISIILIISVLINIGLAINISKNNKNDDQINKSFLSRAAVAIDNAINISGQITSNWDKLSEEELIQKLGQTEKEFAVAVELMNAANAYFYPVKTHREHSKLFSHWIIEKGKTQEVYNEYKNEYDDLRVTCEFLAKNPIIEIGIDEVRLRWDELN